MVSLSSDSKFSVSSSGGYLPESVLRSAFKYANRFPLAKAGKAIRRFLDGTRRHSLTDGDFAALVADYTSAREKSRREFLEGAGLVPDPECAGRYLPGTWRLTTETDKRDCWGVIDGVRAASGEFVAVRLTAAQFMRAGASLRAIRKAVGAAEHIGLTAAEWRRIWEGCDVRGGYGIRRWSRGLRLSLNDQLWEVGR